MLIEFKVCLPWARTWLINISVQVLRRQFRFVSLCVDVIHTIATLKQNGMLLNFRFHVVIIVLVLSSTASLSSFPLFFVGTPSAVFSHFNPSLSYMYLLSCFIPRSTGFMIVFFVFIFICIVVLCTLKSKPL